MYGLYGLYGGCTACTGLYGPCTDGQGVRNVRRVREYGLSGTIVRGRPHPVAPCTGCPGQLPWGCPSSRTRRPRTRPVHKGAPKSVYGRVRPYKRRTCTDFHGLRPECHYAFGHSVALVTVPSLYFLAQFYDAWFEQADARGQKTSS